MDDGSTHVRQWFVSLGTITGTEQDALDQLVEIASERVRQVFGTAGCRIAQDGTSIVVSKTTPLLSENTYEVDCRYSAVRVLTTVPPRPHPVRPDPPAHKRSERSGRRRKPRGQNRKR